MSKNNKHKILIVEDSNSNRLFLVELLHDDFIVESCDTGEEGLELADKFRPDIVLLDIILPKMDGHEVCRMMRQNANLGHTKILFISSQKEAKERIIGYHSGAEDYITKPIVADELLAKINVFLRLQSAEEVAVELKVAYQQTISSLVKAMEAKDEYTSGHSERVAYFAAKLGQFLNLSPIIIQQLQWAGRVHDIGKIGIPDEILTKKGRLTDEEFEMIKSHPEKGFKVLEPVKALSDILIAVKYHHEHYDGSGYPEKLQGPEIPYIARVLQIADVWDALTSRRSYREAMSYHEAQQVMIKDAGKILDPFLVAQFFRMLKNTDYMQQPILDMDPSILNNHIQV